MTKSARQEYTAAVRGRYLAADREEKSRILEEYCRTLRGHRKAAIRALRRRPEARRRAGRAVMYDRAVVPVLVGRDRYSSRAAYQRLQRLYELVRVQGNFFRLFRKLLAGRRVGSKRVRRYDAAPTPYQRLLAAGGLPVPG